MVSGEVISYVINFIVGAPLGNKRMPDTIIGYTSDEEKISQYPIIIKPSGFFELGIYGSPASYPITPLSSWHGIPLLYGEEKEEIYIDQKGVSHLIIHADIIASAYFLISRYEEMFKRNERDHLGRFPGKSSLPFNQEFIHRPIADEYGKALRSILADAGFKFTPPTQPLFSGVNFLHSINRMYEYTGVKDFLKLLFIERKPPLKAFHLTFSNKRKDPFYTFPRFVDWENDIRKTCTSLQNIKTLFFLKTPGGRKEDRPHYKLTNIRMRNFWTIVRKNKVKIGLLCNYSICLYPDQVKYARKYLYYFTRFGINISMNYELCAREPEDMVSVLNSGIKHEFSLGYYDVPGFRLGTSRPVKFINPNTGILYDLIQHPLCIYDKSITQDLKDDYDNAHQKCIEILNNIAANNGELNIHFSNEYLSKDVHPLHSRLYRDLLRHIAELEENYIINNNQ